MFASFSLSGCARARPCQERGHFLHLIPYSRVRKGVKASSWGQVSGSRSGVSEGMGVCVCLCTRRVRLGKRSSYYHVFLGHCSTE